LYYDRESSGALEVEELWARISPLNNVNVVLVVKYKTDDQELIRSAQESLKLLVKDAVKRHWEDARGIKIRFRQHPSSRTSA